MIVMRVRGLPLVSSCATGRRMYLRADPPNLVAQIRTWQACDVGAATGAGYDGAMRSISARALLMPGRIFRPAVVPAPGAKAALAEIYNAEDREPPCRRS